LARIALVHDVAGVAETQATVLRKAGHDVDQVALSMLGASWPWPFKALALPIRLMAYVPVILRLRRGRYDVVHIHWLSQGVIGLFLGRPFFVQSHGSDLHVNLRNPALRVITRIVLRRAAVIFYVTPNLKAFLRGFEEKARYLPNPVDVDAFIAAPPPGKVSTAVIFTRLDPVKGVDVIFQAVERLSHLVELTGLDWGPLARKYVKRYRTWVAFARPFPHADVARFLQRFDLVIGQMFQGILSLSEIEAMAAGRPLMTGIDTSLYASDPPPVVVASDADGMVAAVTRLQHDAVELARLSNMGRVWARRNHGLEQHRELLEASYFGRMRAASPTVDVPGR
jgi:glycosyltransferase involved in cell wall biosynthesis